jgi:hypothetical protein
MIFTLKEEGMLYNTIVCSKRDKPTDILKHPHTLEELQTEIQHPADAIPTDTL